MGPHFASYRVPRSLGWLVALAAMAAAIAAISIPATAGKAGDIAPILAVGAIAMMAGHAWGLVIVTLADTFLLGKLVTTLLAGSVAGTDPAMVIGLLGTLPGPLLLERTLPRAAEALVGVSGAQSAMGGRAYCSVVLVAAAVLPIV